MRTPVQTLRFDFERACQAVACLLRPLPGQRMNYMRLLKLLYLAERKSLAESGAPMAGGSVVAMERGPVLEDVFSLIRQKHACTPEWSQYFRLDHYELVMLKDPGNRRLTPIIVDILNAVASMHEEHDEFDMVDITHHLPEWKKNDPGKSSRPIPLRDILEAVGRGDEFEQIIEYAQRKEVSARVFSDLPRTDCGESVTY